MIVIKNGHVSFIRQRTEQGTSFSTIVCDACEDHEPADLKFLLIELKKAEAYVFEQIVLGEADENE